MAFQLGTWLRDQNAAQDFFTNALASSTQIILVTTAERLERFVGPSSSRTYRHINCKVLHNAEHDPDRARLESEVDGRDHWIQWLRTVEESGAADS